MSYGPAGYEPSGRYVDTVGDAFYPLYRRLFGEESDFADDLARKLAEARMAHNVELYLSVALALGTIFGLLLWLAGVAIGYTFFGGRELDAFTSMRIPNETLLGLVTALRVPLAVLTTGVVLGSIGFGAVFGTLVLVPYVRAGRRRREINLLLPDAVSFMYALSMGGLNQLEIFEAIADADDTYGEVAREFRTILQETTYFDTDYRSAIRQQAFETPSDDLSQFLTDMLSVIDSGGDMTRFLEHKKSLHFRTAKQEQERVLETLELFAEIFVTVSLFPLLLIIVLIILSILGQGQPMVLYATVYALIPLFGVAFLVIVSTVLQDEPGDGVLDTDHGPARFEDEADRGLFDQGLVEEFVGRYRVFDRIKRREGTYETLRLLQRPDHFLRDHPSYSLALTVPAALMVLAVAVATGSVPTTVDAFVDNYLWATVVYLYVPLLLVGVPLAVFYEWNLRSRYGIVDNLSENLRKLSSANDTGLTLLDSIRSVADTSTGRFARELEVIAAKSEYGMNLSESLVVFNNKYRIPPLARTVKLISKAQEASNQISQVLTTAAQAAENREDIDRERVSSTRMQVVIILMTFLTLLAVMAILKVRFLDVMAQFSTPASGGSAATNAFTSGLNIDRLSMLFFHAVTLQAVVTGLASGYIRDARILSGAKYVVALLLVTLLAWVVVA